MLFVSGIILGFICIVGPAVGHSCIFTGVIFFFVVNTTYTGQHPYNDRVKGITDSFTNLLPVYNLAEYPFVTCLYASTKHRARLSQLATKSTGTWAVRTYNLLVVLEYRNFFTHH
jgi:hypothetical protein